MKPEFDIPNMAPRSNLKSSLGGGGMSMAAFSSMHGALKTDPTAEQIKNAKKEGEGDPFDEGEDDQDI